MRREGRRGSFHITDEPGDCCLSSGVSGGPTVEAEVPARGGSWPVLDRQEGLTPRRGNKQDQDPTQQYQVGRCDADSRH